MKKGMGLVGMLLALIFITAMFVVARNLTKDEGPVESTNDFLKDQLELNVDNIKPPTVQDENKKGPCNGVTKQDPQGAKALIKRVVEEENAKQTNSNYKIEPELMMAIAQIESNFMHCKDGELHTSSAGAFGLMQTFPSTANSECPDLRVEDINDNIKCGVTIFRNKLKYNNQEGYYETQVNKNCKSDSNPDFNQMYLDYKDSTKRALRAYNGFGCTSGADPYYADKVYDVYKTMVS